MPNVFERICVRVEALICSNELSKRQLSSSRGSGFWILDFGFWMKSLNMLNKRSIGDECKTPSTERSDGWDCSNQRRELLKLIFASK
jgi:hypothetical protein